MTKTILPFIPKRALLILLFALFGVSWAMSLDAAGNENAGPALELEAGSSLRVRWDGRPFIIGDTLSLASLAQGVLREVDSSLPGIKVNILQGGSDADCEYYRETARVGQGIEMTLYAKYSPWNYGKTRRTAPSGGGLL